MLAQLASRELGVLIRPLAALAASFLTALVLAAAGAGTPAAAGPCGGQARPPAHWQHVVWIWMENESFADVAGSSSAPYLTQLAGQCGLATAYQAISHPSLPNYIAATSGSDWGITDDDPPSSHPLAQPSIFGQVATAGLTWRGYEESMPSNCDRSDSGRYAVRHNPAVYYPRIAAQCRRWDVPLGTTSAGALVSDLRRGRLPSFAFVTPNLCNDMHDCPIATGDAWLRRWIPRILAGPDYRAGTTVLVVTFDEGSGSSNQVATVVVSPATRPGTRSSTAFTHYSLLKTTEQLLGLPALAHAGDPSTAGMRRAFHL